MRKIDTVADISIVNPLLLDRHSNKGLTLETAVEKTPDNI